MPSTTRAASADRNRVIEQLKEDHKRVKKAYREFQKLDAESDPESCEAIVQQVLQDLHVHTTLEEEMLYPLARQVLDAALLDEAEVEHETAHALMEQLQGMDRSDDKYAARFTVLCEYIEHHVKEEETEMFPQLQKAKGVQWEGVADAMDARRLELQGDAGGPAPGTDDRDAARPKRPEPGREAGEDRKGARDKSMAGITSSGAAGGRRMGD